MIQFFVAFSSTILALVALDLIWISQVARPFLYSKIEQLIEINTAAVILFYLVYVSGVLLFAVYPALNATDSNAWKFALLMGCLFGFFCYATYDLTNMATLRDWTWLMVILDIGWGTFLTGVSATLGYLISRLIA